MILPTFRGLSRFRAMGVGIVLAFGLALLLPQATNGQALASIKGTVYDSSGGVEASS